MNFPLPNKVLIISHISAYPSLSYELEAKFFPLTSIKLSILWILLKSSIQELEPSAFSASKAQSESHYASILSFAFKASS